ncbi:MAG: hypothetical protein CMJ84_13100 [Planctomycetes bacterium]|jgi:hypothetical protein|nr:hypothetical protein [Planctomycetota bacterium]MDP6408799.1 hypothetical protein [Planctomycetota bacterium]
MKHLHRTTLALLALSLPALHAFQPRFDSVSFAPEAGATLDKELTLEATLYLEDVTLVLNGSEMPPEMLGEAMDEGLIMNASVEVSDEYVSTRGGKHMELLRTFTGMALELGTESDSESMDEFTEIEDSTVRFAWDSDEDDYSVSYEDGSGDEDLLEGLSPDMDFLALLPEGDVDRDDTWEVADVDSLATLFFPGGLAMPSPDDEEGAELFEEFSDDFEAQLRDALDGFSVNCKYNGAREEGDVRVGEIGFKYEGQASLDLSDMLTEMVSLQGGEMDISADIAATVDIEFEGEGTLLWDLGAGHVAGFEMSMEMLLIGDVEADVEAMGDSQSVELTAEVSGEAEWTLETE